MQRSDSIGTLAAALAKAQGQMQNAAKDARNPHFNSRYADLAAIVDAQRGPLSAHELSVVQIPSTPEAGIVALTTLLLHASGEWLQSDELRVQARDAGPQAVGSCLTYLRRYQLAAMVGIAPEDDDAEAGEPRPYHPTPPRPLVDEETGEELQPVVVPFSSVLPGFHYVDDYHVKGEWHEATLLKWRADGTSLRVSTKLAAIGALLGKAAERRLPIKVDVTMKKNRTDEGYLNRVQFYDAEQTDEPA
jgi:hypothetical protein